MKRQDTKSEQFVDRNMIELYNLNNTNAKG